MFWKDRATLPPNAKGGPGRNVKAHILGICGPSIEGLYKAVELDNIWSNYQSSTKFAETILFGRIATREAAPPAERSEAGAIQDEVYGDLTSIAGRGLLVVIPCAGTVTIMHLHLANRSTITLL